jgi:hypothetical protein
MVETETEREAEKDSFHNKKSPDGMLSLCQNGDIDMAY